MSNYKNYKRKLRWKSSIRKEAQEMLPGMMPPDPFHAPGRTCPRCGGGIATAEGQTPPNFCTHCGSRYFDDQLNTMADIENLPTTEHPQGLE